MKRLRSLNCDRLKQSKAAAVTEFVEFEVSNRMAMAEPQLSINWVPMKAWAYNFIF